MQLYNTLLLTKNVYSIYIYEYFKKEDTVSLVQLAFLTLCDQALNPPFLGSN